MLRVLLNFFRRPTIRMGRVDNARIRRNSIRNAQFISFISQSGGIAPLHPDQHDRRLRWQRSVRLAAALAVAAAGAWIVIESAQALEIF